MRKYAGKINFGNKFSGTSKGPTTRLLGLWCFTIRNTFPAWNVGIAGHSVTISDPRMVQPPYSELDLSTLALVLGFSKICN